MLILSNCLTDTADEGCLKVANSLIKRIKKSSVHVTVVSYERRSKLTDVFLDINKLMLSRKLYKLIKDKKEGVVYFPFPARMLSTAIRVFVLSLFARYGFKVVMTMQSPVNALCRMLFKMSRAELVVLSKSSFDYYRKSMGEKVHYLRTGVDTERFLPVIEEQKKELKRKYSIPESNKVILHVGHLKYGRNIEQFLKIDSEYHLVLVTSTLTKDEQDAPLREMFLSRKNATLIDTYLPNIEEIYQLSDVYFFPVVEAGNCIDIPLSAMEAAACNIPVVTTDYGEMKEFRGKSGFYFIDSFDEYIIKQLLRKALSDRDVHSRDAVLNYDWSNATAYFMRNQGRPEL